MSAEEIAKLLNTGNTEDSTLLTLLGEYFYSPTQRQGYSDCESDDGEDECDGLLVTTPEQLHFTSQQELSQHLEQQEEEHDDEELLITPATSNTIVVEPEDIELDEKLWI
uniref:Uncharacterized protein n=1 Tax=Amphimedon queenslandica TaxID=400682 RepID=A0A1X7U6Q5_AMPQE